MTSRGRRPRRWRWLVGSSTLLLAVLASACGSSSGGPGPPSPTSAWRAEAISFGTTESPTGCNPNTAAGDTPGTQTVLAGVLPSPFVPDVVNSASEPMANAELIVSAEPVSLKPLTIVYTLNPKAVWSDGVPITAEDFKYAWDEQRGDPVDLLGRRGEHCGLPRHRVGDGLQRRPHRDGEVQHALRRLAGAVRQPRAGPRDGEGRVEPRLHHGRRGRRPLGRPVHARHGDATGDHPGPEPEVVGDAGQLQVDHDPLRVLDGAAGPVDGLGLRAGGGARHGDAVVPDPDDGAAGGAERGGHVVDAVAAGHGQLPSTPISRRTSGSPSP